MNDVIYLDHAAATPLDNAALKAMTPFLTTYFYNPSSPYAPAAQVRHVYEDSKHTIATLIGASADELVMTAGATESINLAFSGVHGHVITSAIEHHAVLAAAKQHDHTLVDVTKHGVVRPEIIAAAIRPDTELVSIALANNEIGTIQSLRAIADIIQAERQRRREAGETRSIYFHSDASQGTGLIDIHVARFGVDMLTLNAAKVYGPKQVGLLWTKPAVRLEPLVVGGGQERGLRSGTENVAGTIGFAVAFQKAEKKRKGESERLRSLRDTLRSALIAAFPDAVVSGYEKKQLPNFLHISFPGIDAERVLFLLESQGVLLATGSACAANSGTRSHVLTAIGLAPEVADGSLRMTLGRSSDDESIAIAIEKIIAAVRSEQERIQ